MKMEKRRIDTTLNIKANHTSPLFYHPCQRSQEGRYQRMPLAGGIGMSSPLSAQGTSQRHGKICGQEVQMAWKGCTNRHPKRTLTTDIY